MFKKRALTILLITDQAVVRADFGSGKSPRLVGYWQQPLQGGGAALANSAELAITLGPKKLGKRVLVLTTSAWTQTISVNAFSVSGMNDDELAQTLKFEVEPFSGIGAFESLAGHVDIAAEGAEERSYWVTQVASHDASMLDEVIHARGSKLIGVCHPAGLPVSMSGSASWQRMEFWPETVCCVSATAGLRIFLVNADPRSDRWQASEGDLDTAASTEWLVGPETAVPHEHLGSNVISLGDEPGIRQWLSAWAGQANSRQIGAPVVAPAAKTVGAQTRVSRGIAVGAAALVLCLCHWGYATWQIGKYEQAAAGGGETQEDPRKQYETRAKEIEKEIEELQTQLASAQELEASVSALSGRSRFANLLKALAQLRTEDIVLNDISSNKQGMLITGTALTPGAATALGEKLRQQLARDWQPLAPTQSGRDQLSNGGPWDFQMTLLDKAAVRSSDEAEAESDESSGKEANAANAVTPVSFAERTTTN